MLKYKVLEQQIENSFTFFRENRIEPILIKGWAASQKYPEKYRRLFSDIDLAVAPGLFDNAFLLLAQDHLTIDLHKGLRHLDTLEWKILFDNSQLLKIGDTNIRVLAEEDHLRVLCVHWLTDGGAYKEKLWDIYYAVENRSEKFDWERCLDVVSEKRRLWIIYTIGLASKYLDLDISKLPFERQARQLPVWLVKTVENEWASSVRLRPIHTCLKDRREVLKQIIKRFPPNAIQATVESEGDFDETSRIKYQLRSLLVRIKPSMKRILKTALNK